MRPGHCILGMKRFRFEFDSLLRVRRAQESHILGALQSAQQDYQSALKFKAEIQEGLHKADVRQASFGAEIVTMELFHREAYHLVSLRRRRTLADQRILKASRVLERAMRAYQLIKKKIKMLETLEEKKSAAYRLELNRQERRLADDLTLMRNAQRHRRELNITLTPASSVGTSGETSQDQKS